MQDDNDDDDAKEKSDVSIFIKQLRTPLHSTSKSQTHTCQILSISEGEIEKVACIQLE